MLYCHTHTHTHTYNVMPFYCMSLGICIVAKLVLLSIELQLVITPEKGNKNRFRWCYNESMNTNYYTHIIMGINTVLCVLPLCVLQQFMLHRSGTVGILNSSVSFHLVHTSTYDRYEETNMTVIYALHPLNQ